MNITILTYGSRGDVEPFLALGRELMAAGHRVKLVAPVAYAEWIRAYGVDCYPLRFDLGDYLKRAETSPSRPRSPFKRLSAMKKDIYESTLLCLQDYLTASEGADLIVQAGAALGGLEIAQRRGIPIVFAHPFPHVPTGEFPSFMIPWRLSIGRAYNRWTQRQALKVGWRFHGRALNDWRSDHFGLPLLRSYQQLFDVGRASGAPTLYFYSRHIVPMPLDWGLSDHVTGYWYLDPLPSWRPPADLVSFLETGPAPVCVGFGSMPLPNAEERTRRVIGALTASGQRGVLITGGGGALTKVGASSSIYFVDHIPFHWLYPRARLVVHHGGAGTTGAAIRAGVPSVILPHHLDQFAWADRVEKLGVGLVGHSLRKLRTRSLSRLITRALFDTGMKERVSAMSAAVRAEGGLRQAVRHIETALQKRA